MPDEYSGSDETVAELRAARREAVAMCRLQATVTSYVPGQINDSVQQSIQDQTADLIAHIDALDVDGGGDGGGAGPDVGAEIEDARDWLHADAWFGLGVAVALFFGYFLYRAVSPRA